MKDKEAFFARRSPPPYGREVESARNSGQPFPDGQRGVWITCGRHAWGQAVKTRAWNHLVMVLPPKRCASQFFWPVTRLDVVVLIAGDIDRTTLEALGTEIVYAGTLRVLICDPENQKLDNPTVGFKPRREAA